MAELLQSANGLGGRPIGDRAGVSARAEILITNLTDVLTVLVARVASLD